MMVRCIGEVDYPALGEFEKKLAESTAQAKVVTIKTPAGTDIKFYNNPKNPVTCDVGYADEPGTHMLCGQIGRTPELETINGKIVFDGSITPPIGLLRDPVTLFVEKGAIKEIDGRREAKAYENWLKGFNDPFMLQLAHVCYGFNPGARLTGNIVEDERA